MGSYEEYIVKYLCNNCHINFLREYYELTKKFLKCPTCGFTKEVDDDKYNGTNSSGKNGSLV
jgi:DNA-directed RNA polymerase subunit RPC12/RpoP